MMKMKRSFEYYVNCDRDRAFRLAVLYEHHQEWFHDDNVIDLHLLGSIDEPEGFLMKHYMPDGKIVTSTHDYSYFSVPDEVRTVERSAVLDSGENVKDVIYSPYEFIAQRLTFFPENNRTKVKHEIYLETKGFFAWVICALLVFRSAKNYTLKMIDNLNKYLASQ